MNNQNHPKKGSVTKVEPIRQKAAIERIKAVLLDKGNYRDHCLFTIGINTGFRANELLSITLSQVEDLNVGDVLELKQSKNRRYRSVALNKTVVAAIRLFLKNDRRMRQKNFSQDSNDYLFYSQRAGVLTVSSLTNMVKKWCEGAGCKGQNFGSHTMRKTWGYWQFKRGTPVPLLMEAYGHATQQQTLAYLSIQAEDIKKIYTMEL